MARLHEFPMPRYKTVTEMLALTDKQTSQCELFLDELYRWNERVNLTSVPREQAWSRHIEEGLEFAEAIASGDSVVDVGSGSGVPGLVVAVARDVAVTLVEADQRKAGFLMHVAGLLQLDNVSVASARAESLSRSDSYRATFDVAVSRAAGPVATVLEWSLPLLKDGGKVLISAREDVEVETLPLPAIRRGGLLEFSKPRS
jgi:16S rRNA (guanine527-N7)-methyltransferase